MIQQIGDPGSNRYLEKLGIERPRIEDFVRDERVKLFHLMVLTLLERGERMSLKEIADRLLAAGLDPFDRNLERSLLKAWHGLEPVYRDPQDRFGINLDSRKLQFILLHLGIWRRGQSQTPPPADPEIPGDDVPLTENELRAAFKDRSLYYISTQRQAAAALDVMGRAGTVSEVDAYLGELSRYRFLLAKTDFRYWRSTAVTLQPDDRLVLDRDHPNLRKVRRQVRELARPTLVLDARDEYYKKLQAEYVLERAAREFRQEEEARAIRRAIVRALPEGKPPKALGVLDVAARSIRVFLPAEFSAVPEHLAGFGLLAGLEIRAILDRFGLDQSGIRVVDLKPPQKSRRLNRSGRTLAITSRLLIPATTGISRPLADPKKIAGYIARGDTRKLLRRLESDLKALHAYYRYGILHRYVRLRWGFLDEALSVDWALPGDPSLYAILESAKESCKPLEIVFGSAPGWSDPWARAQAARVAKLEDFPWVVFNIGLERFMIPAWEIQAARIME